MDIEIDANNTHEEFYTVVYDADGKELGRKEGRVHIKPNEFGDTLPLTYRHVRVTTEVICSYKIEK